VESHKEQASNDMYMTANSGALKLPGLLQLNEDCEPYYPDIMRPTAAPGDGIQLWIGPKGAITPTHHDQLSVLHTQVVGRKKWTFFAPDQHPYLYNDESVYSSVDPLKPDYTRFPMYKDVQKIEEVMHPGETLFMPTGWWHHVTALDPVISITYLNFNPLTRQVESDMFKVWSPHKDNVKGVYEDAWEEKAYSRNIPADEFVNDEIRTRVQYLVDKHTSLLTAAQDVTKMADLRFGTIRTLLRMSCSTLPSDLQQWLQTNWELNKPSESMLTAAYGSNAGWEDHILKSWEKCHGIDLSLLFHNIARRNNA